MGLKISMTEMNKIMDTFSGEAAQRSECLSLCMFSAMSLISEDGLSGKAFSSAKEFMRDVYLPIFKGLIYINERINEANNSFRATFYSQVDASASAMLDTDQMQQSVDFYGFMSKNKTKYRPDPNAELKSKLEAQIQRMIEFNGCDLYSDIIAFAGHIQTCVSVFKDTSVNIETGEYTYSIENTDAFQAIHNAWDSELSDKLFPGATDADLFFLYYSKYSDEAFFSGDFNYLFYQGQAYLLSTPDEAMEFINADPDNKPQYSEVVISDTKFNGAKFFEKFSDIRFTKPKEKIENPLKGKVKDPNIQDFKLYPNMPVYVGASYIAKIALAANESFDHTSIKIIYFEKDGERRAMIVAGDDNTKNFYKNIDSGVYTSPMQPIETEDAKEIGESLGLGALPGGEYQIYMEQDARHQRETYGVYITVEDGEMKGKPIFYENDRVYITNGDQTYDVTDYFKEHGWGANSYEEDLLDKLTENMK